MTLPPQYTDPAAGSLTYTSSLVTFNVYYRYISIRQPSADSSSSLGSKLISSNAPTYDFYLRELLRSELTYLLTIFSLSRLSVILF